VEFSVVSLLWLLELGVVGDGELEGVGPLELGA
jgi:hypothetical protein